MVLTSRRFCVRLMFATPTGTPIHSQIGLTMNTYSHVSPTMLGEAARLMETALWASPDDPQQYP
jgi:hypothetical protein